ncbi:hypothetical protein D047_0354A, partial [Vibrio parahaemolyticus VPTS-2010_2]
MLSLLLESQ